MTDSVYRLGRATRSSVSHGRTDGRTDEEATHLEMNSSPNASRAGGLNEINWSGGESGALTRHRGDEGKDRFDFPSPGDQRRPPLCPGSRRWMDGDSTNQPLTPLAGRPSKNHGKAQGNAVRTLTRETNLASCTNSAARRIQARDVRAQRHHPQRAARSPIAGWHDKSRGSNPLRPPTWISAANRFGQCGCACFSLPSILPGKDPTMSDDKPTNHPDPTPPTSPAAVSAPLRQRQLQYKFIEAVLDTPVPDDVFPFDVRVRDVVAVAKWIAPVAIAFAGSMLADSPSQEMIDAAFPILHGGQDFQRDPELRKALEGPVRDALCAALAEGASR